MAGGKEPETPLPNTNPQIEWSTREKLAIASYVMRSGEQHWSGAGRFLRPLGEPGRPFDWFSPKYCAQQYTALMVQADTPRRKRGDRSESSENVQPSIPPEEAIIGRLTRERIEELKKQVRNERTEYRKLKRDIEMIESGEFDDRLDELLGEANNTDEDTEKSKPVKDEDASEGSPEIILESSETTTDLDNCQPISSYDTMETEEVHSETEKKLEVKLEDKVESEKLMETSPSQNDQMAEKMEVIPPDCDSQPSDTQPIVEEEGQKEDQICSEEEEVVEQFTEESAAPESDAALASETLLQNEELNMGDEPSKEVEPLPEKEFLPSDDAKFAAELSQDANEGENTEENESENNLEESPKMPLAEPAPIKFETAASETTVSQGTDNFYAAQADEESKQPASVPSTPAASGSFSYDSTFPSSPALSHSSDMDPETAANLKAWRKSIMILWKQVASHRYASIFLQPVTDEIAPNYSTTVYRSTDLATIKRHIENGVIRTTSEFSRDIMLMFQNALMYNSLEHDVYIWTLEMQKDFIDQFAQFRATQMMVETSQPPENKSLRRSTMRRSVLSEKSQSTRSRRSAVSEVDSKSSH